MSHALCCQNPVNINTSAKLDSNTKVSSQVINRAENCHKIQVHITCWPLCFLFWSYLVVSSRNIFWDAYYVYCTSVTYLIPHNAIFLRKVPMDLQPIKTASLYISQKTHPKVNYFSKRKWTDSFLAKPKKNSFVKNKSQE